MNTMSQYAVSFLIYAIRTRSAAVPFACRADRISRGEFRTEVSVHSMEETVISPHAKTPSARMTNSPGYAANR